MNRFKNFIGIDTECCQQIELDELGDPIMWSFEFADSSGTRIAVSAATELEAWERLDVGLDKLDFEEIELDSGVSIFTLPSVNDFTIQQE